MTATYIDLAGLQPGAMLPAAEQRAHNPSTASENKIHDDDTAKRYGFRGGLVPGATSYAYLAGWLTRRLGPEWAASGSSSIALVRPVYEGEIVRLGGTVTSVSGNAERGAIALDCWVDGPDGVRRAPGTAALTWGAPASSEPLPDFATTSLPPRLPDERSEISAATAPVGDTLPPVLLDTDPETMARYLDDIDSHDPLFREGSPFGGPLVHPGWYPGAANRMLSQNFRLGPWIHTRSEIRHLAPAMAGGTYHAYGRIIDAFEKRGHEYVTADVLIADAGNQPVARITHTAIVVVAAKE
jgi:acyl dehydratase